MCKYSQSVLEDGFQGTDITGKAKTTVVFFGAIIDINREHISVYFQKTCHWSFTQHAPAEGQAGSTSFLQ